MTSVLLSGLDDCIVTVHWLWSWDANVLLCFAQSLSVLETVPLLAANTPTAGLSQWFRKGIFYQNKKANGVAGTDQKPSASWQIAFLCETGLCIFWRKKAPQRDDEIQRLVTKLWFPIERKNDSLSRKVCNYEWMNDLDPYRSSIEHSVCHFPWSLIHSLIPSFSLMGLKLRTGNKQKATEILPLPM